MRVLGVEENNNVIQVKANRKEDLAIKNEE